MFVRFWWEINPIWNPSAPHAKLGYDSFLFKIGERWRVIKNTLEVSMSKIKIKLTPVAKFSRRKTPMRTNVINISMQCPLCCFRLFRKAFLQVQPLGYITKVVMCHRCQPHQTSAGPMVREIEGACKLFLFGTPQTLKASSGIKRLKDVVNNFKYGKHCCAPGVGSVREWCGFVWVVRKWGVQIRLSERVKGNGYKRNSRHQWIRICSWITLKSQPEAKKEEKIECSAATPSLSTGWHHSFRFAYQDDYNTHWYADNFPLRLCACLGETATTLEGWGNSKTYLAWGI